MTESVFRSGQTGAERKFGTDVSKQRPCRARWEYLTSCARWRQARKTALAQLRPQGRNGRNGEVRGTHPEACRQPPRHGGTGGTIAHRPAGAARPDRHPAPPLAGDPPPERNPASLPPPIQQENHSIGQVFTQPGPFSDTGAPVSFGFVAHLQIRKSANCADPYRDAQSQRVVLPGLLLRCTRRCRTELIILLTV